MKANYYYFAKRAQKRCSFPLILISIFALVLFLKLISSLFFTTFSNNSDTNPLGDALRKSYPFPELPRFAYLISGSKGDSGKLKRLLQAVYHPRNSYLLHLDLEASDDERLELAKFVKSEAVIREFRSVMVVGKANLVTLKGPTTISSLLHGVAILLKQAPNWDWFINLSASDYPLMPQDDILHIFSFLPRDLNFLEHTSDLGWKEFQRARPIIIDSGLYHVKKSGVFWAKEKRSIPASFKLFTGSTGVVLTRSFLEFCIWGWDNLPRTLLLYYTNFLSSHEGYFHTLLCNHKDYQNTTVNHDLHYVRWDEPRKENPTNLTIEHFDDMVQSGAVFGHRFGHDSRILDKIDKEILRRSAGLFVPGGWCLGNPGSGKDPCIIYGNPDVIKPSERAKRLEALVMKLLDSENFRSKQCK
ncbi:OLC1v1034817C1 [Oldenlandia corymbosa var. corymbosa]|uniref:OLC1v1034817C1 n=1 Tax=Oldenlandia corymbosa var. corymbosa TaxID=529605 RepID=A0AAV1CSU5_OLDCO|nr:OLC1v1034817C1 [Oldenlandia corymbosa var. corymbosa]